MTDWLLEHLFYRPAPMRTLGWLLLQLGAGLAVAGLLGRVLTAT